MYDAYFALYPMHNDLDQLRNTYQANEAAAGRFLVELTNQVSELLNSNQIVLGVPLEGRVKGWESLVEKLDRKSKNIESVFEIDDLIGLRIIVLFRSSLAPSIDALKQHFSIISFEDTASRLTESQFGYQSQHLILKMPEAWLKIPTFAAFSNFRAEVQVRTLAQHIWAAASHKLQYKQEDNVPPPLKRTIHRISALLETADLELDRVLDEKSSYAQTIAEPPIDQTPLNVDLLESVLDGLLNPKARSGGEDYATVLADLAFFKINTTEDLRELIESTRDEVAKFEETRKTELLSQPVVPSMKARLDKGVLYNHAGLARAALKCKFGEEAWAAYRGEPKAKRRSTRSKA